MSMLRYTSLYLPTGTTPPAPDWEWFEWNGVALVPLTLAGEWTGSGFTPLVVDMEVV